MLSGVHDQLQPLRAWLFPRRVLLQLEDQAITAMVLEDATVTWMERVPLPIGLCDGGVPRRPDALGDLIGDLLVERGFGGAGVAAVLAPAAAQVRLVHWAGKALPADPELLLLRHQRSLRLGAPWYDLDLHRLDFSGDSPTSLVVSVRSALLESWIEVFSLAALRLDRIEASQICLSRALRSLLRDAAGAPGLIFLLEQERWGARLLVLEAGLPVFERPLGLAQDPARLQAELERCRDFLRQTRPQQSAPPLLLLHGGAVADEPQAAALAAALGWPCERLDLFARGWLLKAAAAAQDPLGGGALLALWGLAMAEVPA